MISGSNTTAPDGTRLSRVRGDRPAYVGRSLALAEVRPLACAAL
jgi:hypothetical protein